MATFLVNVVGAVILGAVAEVPAGRLPHDRLSRPAIGTGFCGGLTTFSTMSLEIYRLWPGYPQVAAAYAAASMAAASVCAWAGVTLTRTARSFRDSRRTAHPPRERSTR